MALGVTKPVIEKMAVVEKEARKPYRKVKESIHIQLRGASLNRTDGHDLPDLKMPLLRKEVRGSSMTDQHTSGSLTFPKVMAYTP